RLLFAFKKLYELLFAFRPAGISLEAEEKIANDVYADLSSGRRQTKPLCRIYGGSSKRFSLPPAPLLPTEEVVVEPLKYLESKISPTNASEMQLIESSFRHLKHSTGSSNTS